MSQGARRIGRGFAAVVLVLGLVGSEGFAGPLDPMQFSSLGTLSLTTPGTYTINTAGGTPSLMVGGTTYYGVVSNGIAVFDFSSITTASGTLLTASQGAGGLPVALLSQADATLNGRIDVSGFGGVAGTGASNTGVGGNGTSVLGSGGYTFLASGAGGGGFGGQGSYGGNLDGLAGGVGGSPTATLANQLQGGSRGGNTLFGQGGAGGGAIEIGATGRLTISGEVDAIGGDSSIGGGGSGGGIFLHGSSVAISGILDVQGGAGGYGNTSGPATGYYASSGGGGGGAILVEFASINNYTFSGSILDQGGSGGSGLGLTGQFGTAILGVPEPSSLVLLGTSILAWLGTAVARRRRAREF